MAAWNHKPTPHRPILPTAQRPGYSSGQWTPAVKVHTPPCWQPPPQPAIRPRPGMTQGWRSRSRIHCQTSLGGRMLPAYQHSGRVLNIGGHNGSGMVGSQSCEADRQALESTGLRLNSLSVGLNQVNVGKRPYMEICESSVKRFRSEPANQSNGRAPVLSNCPPPVAGSCRISPRDGKEYRHQEKNATTHCRPEQGRMSNQSLINKSVSLTSCHPGLSASSRCEIIANTTALVCMHLPSLTEPFSRLRKIQFLCIPREICMYILGKATSRKEKELLIDYLAKKTEICGALNGSRCNICNAKANGPSKSASTNLGTINHEMAIFRQKNPQVIALMEVTGMKVDVGSLGSINAALTNNKSRSNSASRASVPHGKEQSTQKAATLMKLPKSVSNIGDGTLPKSTEQKGSHVHAKSSCFTVVSESIGGSGDIEGKISVFSCGSVTFKTFALKDGKDDLEITTMEFDKDAWNKMCHAGRPAH